MTIDFYPKLSFFHSLSNVGKEGTKGKVGCNIQSLLLRKLKCVDVIYHCPRINLSPSSYDHSLKDSKRETLLTHPSSSTDTCNASQYSNNFINNHLLISHELQICPQSTLQSLWHYTQNVNFHFFLSILSHLWCKVILDKHTRKKSNMRYRRLS